MSTQGQPEKNQRWTWITSPLNRAAYIQNNFLKLKSAYEIISNGTPTPPKPFPAVPEIEYVEKACAVVGVLNSWSPEGAVAIANSERVFENLLSDFLIFKSDSQTEKPSAFPFFVFFLKMKKPKRSRVYPFLVIVFNS